MTHQYILIRWHPTYKNAGGDKQKKAKPKWQRLQLPAIIANDARADIIANHPVFYDAPAVLYARNHQLLFQRPDLPSDTQNGISHEAHSPTLQKLGFQIIGPIVGEVPVHPDIKSYVLEMLAKEKALYNKCPRLIRKYTGSHLSQCRRLTWWTVLLVLGFIVATLLHERRSSLPAFPDLSQTSLPFKYDTIVNEVFGATRQMHGYERGISFLLEIPPEFHQKQVKSDLILSFRGAGLNIGGELQIHISNKLLFSSEADPNCITNFCEFHVTIPHALVVPDQTLLYFAHTAPDSAYAIKDLHYREIRPITTFELAQANRWLEIAKRSFNERHLLPENILHAKTESEQTITFLVQRQGTEQLLAQARLLQYEASTALNSQVKELQLAVAMAERLQQFDKAEKYLSQLLRLVPNQEDPLNQHFRQKLQELEEMRR